MNFIKNNLINNTVHFLQLMPCYSMSQFSRFNGLDISLEIYMLKCDPYNIQSRINTLVIYNLFINFILKLTTK